MRDHCYRLIDLVAATIPNPRLGAEIGVWRGQMSRALLEAFPELTLIAVDPWEKGGPNVPLVTARSHLRNARLAFYAKMAPFKHRLKVLRMASVVAAQQVADESLDLAFIDGNHEYPSVKQDMIWFSKVRKGGLFCGDDYGSRHDWPRGPDGVKRAVDEWAAANGRTISIGKRHVWWCLK